MGKLVEILTPFSYSDNGNLLSFRRGDVVVLSDSIIDRFANHLRLASESEIRESKKFYETRESKIKAITR